MLFPVIVGFVVRVVTAVLSYHYSNYDTLSYKLCGQFFLEGKTIYPALKTNYPYFPVFIYLEALAVYLSRFGISHMLLIKLVLACVDTVNIGLIYLLSGKKRKVAYLYALNPISVIVTGLHGQFDAIPIMFLLAAYYLFMKKSRESLVMLIGSMAIAVKTWPLLFLIPIIKRLRNKRIALLLFVFPVMSVILYVALFPKTYLTDIFSVIVYYRGIYGLYGIGWLLGLLLKDQYVFKISTAVMICFVAVSMLHHKKNILAEALGLFLLFFTLSTGIGIQWFMWCVPFLLLVPSSGAYVLLAAISLLYAVSYFPGLLPASLLFVQSLGLMGVWVVFSLLAYRHISIRGLKKSAVDFALRNSLIQTLSTPRKPREA